LQAAIIEAKAASVDAATVQGQIEQLELAIAAQATDTDAKQRARAAPQGHVSHRACVRAGPA
jgi:hypothetical protein